MFLSKTRRKSPQPQLERKQKVDYRYDEPAPAQNEEGTPVRRTLPSASFPARLARATLMRAVQPTPTEEVDDVALCLDRAISKEKGGDVGVKRRRSLTSLIIVRSAHPLTPCPR